MPRTGFRTITVNSDVYKLLKEYAEQHFTTIPRAIEKLIKTYKETKREAGS